MSLVDPSPLAPLPHFSLAFPITKSYSVPSDALWVCRSLPVFSCVGRVLTKYHFLFRVVFCSLKINSLNTATSGKRTQPFALCCCPQVNKIKTPKQIDELIEIESDTGTWYRRCFVRIRTELYGVSMSLFHNNLSTCQFLTFGGSHRETDYACPTRRTCPLYLEHLSLALGPGN